MDCIFCAILSGQSPAQVVYRDDLVTAFHDKHPVAPLHLLVVPNRHIPALSDPGAADEALLGRLALVARRLAEEHGVARTGYRLVVNTGPDSGQIVDHLHLHLIGGRPLPAKMYTGTGV